ncbi:MAG TPA: carboxypeptidase-like regulatory domain-containing protein [Acidobacteriaceae bacterium]|nr:carboxypeptidase-like regulatory domain-containing protein [Acidobacteriaceae bacterium]
MKLKIALFMVLAVAAFCLAPVPAVHAQNLYASIHGTVTDTTGAVVPNATVTVLNTATGIQTVAASNGSGYFILPQLQVGGPYTVTITATGFKNFSQSGLNLSVNDNRDVDAKLEVGSGSTTVQVSATALQVETSDTQLKQVMTSAQLENIPLEGRDPAGLQKLEPGVVESSDRFGSFSSDGSQTPQNSYLLNGIDINDGPLQDEGIQINPDALQEENIIVSTLNPEYARNSGATLNQVVKAGTNQFHGNVFEFYRDTFMNSTPYFATTVPQFHQNLYGATLGGPVIHDKLFFFAAYQGFRQRTGGANVASTLTSANFAGDFSNDFNYATGTSDNTPDTASGFSNSLTGNPIPFSVNGCPAGEPWNQCFNNAAINVSPANWNSVAANTTTKYIPQPNFLGQFYAFNTADTAAADQGILRADYTPTSHDTIWASGIFQSSPSIATLAFGGGSFPGFGTNQAEHFKLFSAAWTHTFNASTLNELRLGYYRFNFAAVEPANPALPSSYGFTGISPQDTAAPGFPYLSIGQFAVGNSYEGPQPRLDTNLTYADNFTKIIGNHSLKLGASYEQFRVDNPFSYLNNGYYYFDGGAGGGGLYSSGDPYLDFELGIPDGYEQTSNGFINTLAAETYAYAQDSWKISPDVTLNYGVGWDVEFPNKNDQFSGLGINCWSNSDTESTVLPGAPPGLAFPGDPGCNRAGGPTPHYNRFGPRIGIAWSPSSGPSKLIGEPGSHSFSIRAGFGLYYNRDQQEQSLQNLEDPPFLLISQGVGDVGGSPSFAAPFTDVSGAGSIPNKFPYAIPTPGDTNIDWQGLYYLLGLATFDTHYSVPYAENFNLNIQRSLPSNMILQVGYIGSLAHRLASWYDGDAITPDGHAACMAGASVFGIPCNSTTLAGSVHTYFPQFTSDPRLAYPAGLIPSFPNGVSWYKSVARQNTEGSSNYNSLQVSLIKARTHGLYATISYTYSHALDNGSGYESSTGANNHAQIYTPGFTYLNYGDSDYDARHRLVGSYIYEIPVFSAIRNNALLRETVAGWEISGVTALQSGFPVGFSQGADRSLWCDGASYFGCGDVPVTSTFHLHKEDPRKIQSFNVNGNQETGHFFFDPSPFSDEPIGTYGNVKRNFFHGPGFNYTNLRFSKNFGIGKGETRYFQLGIEAFNAFNHANFANPGGTFNSSTTFGEISSVIYSADPNGDPSPARSYQLVGKFYF